MDARSLESAPPGASSSERFPRLPPGYSGTVFRPFSPSRRMFCLLCAFDFLLTLLIWMLYLEGFSQGLDHFGKEVKEYQFNCSLFDVLVVSLWRMIMLLLAYALFHSRRWYVIAITTAVTTGFLIAKVFKFKGFQGNSDSSDDDDCKSSHPMDYILVLVSLILCWGETWHLDFKVIPAELRAEERLSGGLATTAGERAPLLRGTGGAGFYTPSWVSEHASFFTPPGSDDENEVTQERTAGRLTAEDRAYIRRGREICHIAWELLIMDDQWKMEKREDDITVESHITVRKKKVYRLKGLLDGAVDDVFELIILHPEDAVKWGNNVTECRVLREIDEHTDIVYNVVAEAGGGMVASRDFVNLRHWERRATGYLSCNVAVAFDGMPPTEGCVRAENGPGGWILQPAVGNPGKTRYTWLFDVDLKGWLPQYVIDAAMTTMLYRSGLSLSQYICKNLGGKTH